MVFFPEYLILPQWIDLTILGVADPLILAELQVCDSWILPWYLLNLGTGSLLPMNGPPGRPDFPFRHVSDLNGFFYPGFLRMDLAHLNGVLNHDMHLDGPKPLFMTFAFAMRLSQRRIPAAFYTRWDHYRKERLFCLVLD